MFKETLDLLYKYRDAFTDGLLVTLHLMVIVWCLGLLLGTTLGVLTTKNRIFSKLISILSFILNGIPVLVFLFWLHYPAQSLFSLNVSPFITATIMLSVINILGVAEIVKNGIKNLPNQYIEVANLCQISTKKRIFNIELPLILRHIISALLTFQVNVLHLSLFASLISVNEIFRVTQRIISIEYKPVELYTALGLFFILVSLPLNGLAQYYKFKYERNLSER